MIKVSSFYYPRAKNLAEWVASGVQGPLFVVLTLANSIIESDRVEIHVDFISKDYIRYYDRAFQSVQSGEFEPLEWAVGRNPYLPSATASFEARYDELRRELLGVESEDKPTSLESLLASSRYIPLYYVRFSSDGERFSDSPETEGEVLFLEIQKTDLRLKNLSPAMFKGCELQSGEEGIGTYTPRRFVAYNVGQAVYTELDSSEGVLAAFDIGLPLKRFRKREPLLSMAIETLQHSDYRLVVISHYDFDHISGFEYLSYNQVSHALWVCENPMGLLAALSQFARGMVLCLLIAGRFRYVKQRLFQTGHLRFLNNAYYRKPKRCYGCKRHCTKMNYKGLSTLIETDNRRIFLPGDAMYAAWPKEIGNLDRVDLLLIPHHAMPLGNCRYPIKRMGGSALASTGFNSYGHPGVDHLDDLRERFYFVERLDRGLHYVHWLFCSWGVFSFQFYFE